MPFQLELPPPDMIVIVKPAATSAILMRIEYIVSSGPKGLLKLAASSETLVLIRFFPLS